MIIVDKLCYNSRLRYVNATEKFAFSMITMILCIVSRSIPAAAVILAVNLILTVFIGGIPFVRYLKLMMIPLTFLLLSTIAILFNFSRTPMNAYAIRIGTWYLTNTVSQVYYGIQLIFTALAAVSCLYFLSLNTTMTDILAEFKRIHLPALFIELMMLIYRYIFVLTDIADKIRISQNSRLGNKDMKTSLHSFGSMVSVLFVRAVKKSGAQYDALESRGYQDQLLVLTENYAPKVYQILLIVFFETSLLFYIIWSHLK